MTNKRRIHPNNPQLFKQVLYDDERVNKYTEAFVTESDFMKTSVWERLRQLIFARDGFRCRNCGSAINIECHHLRYPEVWGEEKLDDLITFCDTCHAKLHNKEKNNDSEV